MTSLLFNKHKHTLLNNELYYSHDERQTMAVYTIVTEEDQRRESRTTCLFRGTSSVPVGEISLGSRSNNHKVVSGLRSIKPSASAFSGGLSIYSADGTEKYTWKDFAYGSWSLKGRRNKQESATVTFNRSLSALPQISIAPPDSLELPLDEIVTMVMYLQLLRLWEEANISGVTVDQVERLAEVMYEKPPVRSEPVERDPEPLTHGRINQRSLTNTTEQQQRETGGEGRARNVPIGAPIQFPAIDDDLRSIYPSITEPNESRWEDAADFVSNLLDLISGILTMCNGGGGDGGDGGGGGGGY